MSLKDMVLGVWLCIPIKLEKKGGYLEVIGSNWIVEVSGLFRIQFLQTNKEGDMLWKIEPCP